MKVVILAGGLGTRISEESYLKPKPMITIGENPLGDKSIFAEQMDELAVEMLAKEFKISKKV